MGVHVNSVMQDYETKLMTPVGCNHPLSSINLTAEKYVSQM
jgi:hypothetical protein